MLDLSVSATSVSQFTPETSQLTEPILFMAGQAPILRPDHQKTE